MITKIEEYITDTNDKKYQFIKNWLYTHLSREELIVYIRIDENYKVNSIEDLCFFSKFDECKSIDVECNYVYKDFSVSFSKLTSLYNGPIFVNNHYLCTYCKLKNLEGIANFIGDDLAFSINPLTSLNGLNYESTYILGGDTIEWLQKPEQQHLIKDLLNENILWYDQFKNCLNDESKREFDWFINTKILSKEE